MAEPTSTPPKTVEYYISEQWDASIDTILRRFAYGAAAGTVAGLILFRGKTTRVSSIALGAGFGAGYGYHENQKQFSQLWGQLGEEASK